MKYKFSVSGLDCPNCAAKLAAMIEGDEKISSCKINFLTERVSVESELAEDVVREIAASYAKKFSSKVTIE